MTIKTTRRTVARGAAWAVPVVAVAATAPAFAASAPPTKLTYVEAIKCSGSSDKDDPKTYVFVFTAASTINNLSVSTIDINGDIFQVEKIKVVGQTVYVQSTSSKNSANASGTLTVSYTSGQPPVFQALRYPYSGTSPDHDVCAIV